MLTLARKLHEELVFTLEDGREIVVRVVEIRKGQVRLRTTAPETVLVARRPPSVVRVVADEEAAS